MTVLMLGLLGVLLGLAAGACQGLEEEDGVFLGDMVRLLAWSSPATVTAKAAGKIGGTVTLYALAGGAAVPVYAGMHAVHQLNRLARHISRDLTFNNGVM